MTRRKYEQVVDGEWFPVPMRGFREQCCDCGLVHVVNYRIVDGRIEMQAIRNNRATAAVRRAKQKG